MARHFACLRHTAGMAALVLLMAVPAAKAPGDDVLALIESDLMAQEAMLAEYGMEETIIEEGAIVIRQGADAYPQFIVRKEEAHPFAFREDHYFAPPPIVVRRIGMRVTVNGAGMPFLQWPYIKPKWDDPGPPPPLGPLVHDAEGHLPRDVDEYWMQKELYLKKNFDYETACVMFWDCLQESSQLSGGQWIIKGPPREYAHYGSFEFYSKQWDRTYNMGILHYFPPNDLSILEEYAKGEYLDAVRQCSDSLSVIFLDPTRWGMYLRINGRPDTDQVLRVLMSDLPQKERARLIPGSGDPDLVPKIHPCPELEARLSYATQRAAELRQQHERRMLPWTGGTAAMPLE